MKEKNKRNIVIGILCTLLVFMGVGYAALNQVLDINGTARSTNTWSIVIKSIAYKEEASGGAIDKGASVGSDRISANFEAEFTKPGDYITYEVVVKNEGTLPAKIDKINTVLPVSQQELSDLSLFSMQYDESIIGKSLPAGASETFMVTGRYKTEATRLPYGDVHIGIQIVAVQDTTGGSGNLPQEPGQTGGWLYRVNSDEQDENYGQITGLNCNSSQIQKDANEKYIAKIPAEVNGIPVTSVNKDSFVCAASALVGEKDGIPAVIIMDDENEGIIREIFDKYAVFMGVPGGLTYIDQGDVEDTSEFQPFFIDLSEYDGEVTGDNVEKIMKEPGVVEVSTLDLSAATNLTTIGYAAFMRANLTAVNLGNTVTTIKTAAFYENQISNLTIPNSVTTIEGGAFAGNQISSLTIPNSVTTIGHTAFGGNQISSLTLGNGITTIGVNAFAMNQISSLTIPDSVTTIEELAFSENQISELTIPDSVTTLGTRAFAYNQISNLTLGNGLKTIGYSAFGYNQISNLVIPNNVTTIGQDAFGNQRDSSNNPTLASITIKKSSADFDALLANGSVYSDWYDTALTPTITYQPS